MAQDLVADKIEAFPWGLSLLPRDGHERHSQDGEWRRYREWR